MPFVITVHDLIYMRTRFTGRSWRQRIGHRYLARNVPRAVRAATRVAVPSEATAAALAEVVSPHPPLDIIPWGVAPPHGWSRAESLSSAPYIVAFSAPDPRKQLDVVLEAWRRLRHDGRLELWILGGVGLPEGLLAESDGILAKAAFDASSI